MCRVEGFLVTLRKKAVNSVEKPSLVCAIFGNETRIIIPSCLFNHMVNTVPGLSKCQSIRLQACSPPNALVLAAFKVIDKATNS